MSHVFVVLEGVCFDDCSSEFLMVQILLQLEEDLN